MPLLSTFGNAGSQSFGTAGIQPGGSAFFGGGVKALSVPGSANFAYGTGDFTVEAWIRPSSYSTWRILWSQTDVYNSRVYWPFLIYLDRFTGQLAFQMHPYVLVHPTALTLNVWSHIAVVRSSSQVRLYVNGNGASTVSAPVNLTNTTFRPTLGNYSLGANQSAGQDFQGYVTNVRVAKSAIYTSNFIPSRSPLTRTSQGATNVQFLLNHKTSSSFLTDASANNLTVTNTGAVTFNALSPYTDPFVTPPAIVIVSATVTPSTSTVSEGSTVTFTVAGTNTVNGTYYYTIEETGGGSSTLTGADFSTGSLSGTFTITGNSGSIPLTVIRDLTTEGDESFSVFVRSGSTTGTVLGSSSIIDITDSSITPAFTVTPASIGEGSAGSFTVANVGPDGTYYWTVLNGTSANADFSAVSGSFAVSGSTGGIENGTGTFSVTPIKDLSTEGAQTFQVQVRSGSIAGTVIVTSASVSITDVSLTPTVTPAAGSVNEGASLSFTAANLGPNGTYYWSINHGTTAAADFSAENGSFSITGGGAQDNGTGTFSVTTLNDYVTEGAQTFTVSVRTGSVSGTVLATSSSVTVNDTSTTVTASGSPTSFNEGASTTITASATAFPNGTYYWTILNGTTTDADFTAASGSFTVSNGVSGAFTVTAATLGGAEAAETFSVQIRTVSTSGTVIATTGTLTINSNAT
jgi:hypothetical protein